MPGTRKRPCPICRRWFYPDRRAGERQRACSSRDCQTARRQFACVFWRRQNPGHAAAHRIDQRHRQPDPDSVRVRAPFDKLPWDVAKDQFGGKGADFIALMCGLLSKPEKDVSSGYPVDSKRFPGNNYAQPEKTSLLGEHTETRSANARVSSTGLPPGASPGPPPGAVPAPVGVFG